MTHGDTKQKNASPKPPLKRIRVKLTYVIRVAEDFPIHGVGQRINTLIAHGVLAFARSGDEEVQIEGGARLQLSAVGGPKASL